MLDLNTRLLLWPPAPLAARYICLCILLNINYSLSPCYLSLQASGNATKNAPLSPVFAESAPASPVHAAPAAKRGRKAGNAKNKKEASEDEETAATGEEVVVVSQKFKRKYEESDPLLFMEEAASPTKARARVSREAELPPASSSKQQSSAQKSAAKSATSSSAAASAQGKKKLFQSGVHKKGEKVRQRLMVWLFLRLFYIVYSTTYVLFQF